MERPFTAGPSVSSALNVAAEPVVVPATNSSEIESAGGNIASSGVLPSNEDLFWETQGPVGLLVDSGNDFLAAGREQAEAIQGLADVRLDLDLVESRLESLQPVLNYSGRIPALSPMQGTVCFTLGWLRKDKAG